MFCNVTVFDFNFLELGLLPVPARNSLWNNKPVLIRNTILGKEDSSRKACTLTEKHTEADKYPFAEEFEHTITI
jgi:hypothetical protein